MVGVPVQQHVCVQQLVLLFACAVERDSCAEWVEFQELHRRCVGCTYIYIYQVLSTPRSFSTVYVLVLRLLFVVC